MKTPTLEVYLTPAESVDALRAEAREGLSATPKWLSPKWFYDARGSELFEEITALPEYYPTRTERGLLTQYADEIAALTEPEILIELGSGSSEKTRLLLDSMTARGTLRTYVPQDVSVTALEGAAQQVGAEFPGIDVLGVVSDFTGSLHHLPGGGRRAVAFLGGTLGNLVPAERAEFLSGIAAVLAPGENLILGVGLVIDPAVLVPAYDDAAGVTAQFNLNVLAVLNKQLGANFPLEDFRHVALWDAENQWIEMRLEALRELSVHIDDLDLEITFAAGEQLRTEISAKFTEDGIAAELASAGFGVRKVWTDQDQRFALLCAQRA
ncbi:L-histidine N(alpha)-methyltransferase [Rhodococcus erythropolis]|uniref:L-histidine N(alpha)-methyltransferase n=1 Tax=Rhodococcus TaxID=1827 RepID=UPI0008A2C96B|nr:MULTISPECIES: L-histidine N(alpha)-methyltransferase [Rhodococcus]MCD2153398.1 L-histidine N(alpha)-methyltransferase [Rhodococcus cerastii]MBT1252994.1 L-histidine N(alpha)-methyltransferase [Rhodococcus erythropolis]MDI9905572.1 L-histidine N(alpha)-methyltransferase [Rhodococcus sp. IEGM 1406]OHF29904.1 dimethylhistidine N-methyltransferase [Rhodococcus erythropolis]QSE39719.1 L-histidine N(alpha)-methyltransferase [Rhodococcus erythropolis]